MFFFNFLCFIIIFLLFNYKQKFEANIYMFEKIYIYNELNYNKKKKQTTTITFTIHRNLAKVKNKIILIKNKFFFFFHTLQNL